MKILCVIDSLGSGGAQRQLVNLAVGFQERDFQVSFLVYHREDFFLNILDKKGIQVYEILEKNYILRLIKMRSFIRNGKYDVLISFLESSNFICEVAGFPSRKWTLIVGERSAKPAIFKSVKLKIYRWFHFFADHVVANSFENMKMVKKINPFLPDNKSHVIYNIVDFEKWNPTNNNHRFKQDGIIKLIVAASHHNLKNLRGLVEAVSLLNCQEKCKIQISWYGGFRGDYSYEQIHEHIKLFGVEEFFSFHPATTQIKQRIEESDVLGLFSFHEGLPNVVCEAMALGKVVIASRISDIPLLLKHDKLLFDPKSPKSIAESLRYIINMDSKEYESVSLSNYENARILFDANRNLNSYIDLF